MKQGLAAVVVAMAATATLLASAPAIKISPLVTEGRVLAAFTAGDAWTIETRETLQFGTAISFDYYVELRRPSALWVDSVVASTNVRADAKFDTLTGKYQVSRQRDGRMIKSDKREQENDVRDWLTVFEPIQLEPESPLKANTEYYIQVRLLKYPRRSVSFMAILPGGSSDLSGRSATFAYLR